MDGLTPPGAEILDTGHEPYTGFGGGGPRFIQACDGS